MTRAVSVHLNPEGRRCGESHWNTVHSDAEVNAVRDLGEQGLGYKRIARRLGLPRSWVKDVLAFRERLYVRMRVVPGE